MRRGAPSRLTVVVPGDLRTRTGGYRYDRRIIAGLRNRGWVVDVRLLDESFPFPTPAARAHAAQVLASIPEGATVLVDGLAFGALPAEVAKECPRLDIVALVHHPLAAETGLDVHAAAVLEDSERQALAYARAVIVTSRATAQSLAQYRVGADRIVVAEPGTDPAPLARGTEMENEAAPSARLLCVATLTPRKGHELLFRALASLRDRRWRLVCAGSLDHDPATAERLRAQLRDSRIDDRVDLVGDLDAAALAVQYAHADLFVLPTWYEGYGMAVAEALARGLPVVSTTTGGIAELVGETAGIVVAPGDLDAFTAALARVLDDQPLRRRLVEGARQVRERLPTWDAAVDAIAEVLGGQKDLTRGHPVAAGRVETATLGGGETRAAGFTADWLALREPVDAVARSARLADAVAGRFRSVAELRILDLGAGTGANLRYLAPRLPLPQDWLLVDHDAGLLARVHSGETKRRVATKQCDLSSLVSAGGLFVDRALVTASALLDLVSEAWVRALVAHCRAAGSVVLFALSYDGRIECTPRDADDDMVRKLINLHQLTDKGFGPALGPNAAASAFGCLSQAGYSVERERSDWVLTIGMHLLQSELIDGWATAAVAVAPDRAAAIAAWRARRLAHAAAGRSQIVVGHEDIAGWPEFQPGAGA